MTDSAVMPGKTMDIVSQAPASRNGRAPAAAGDAEIVLDLSRLLSRVLHSTPTGVDRVEMAYARGLIQAVPERLHFSALHSYGVYGRLDAKAVLRFLDKTEAAWRDVGHAAGLGTWIDAVRSVATLQPRPVPRRKGVPRIYVQASPHHLDSARRTGAILRREDARFVCLVHDLIPIEFPEYARPGGAALHRKRIETIVRHADGIITNSSATQAALAPFVAASGRSLLVRVAHLGVTTEPASPAVATGERPYFICIGTIEPRKNHLLLLNIWRRMAETTSADRIPRLLLVGRRGWENEQVVDMLDRCPSLRGHVEEHGRLPDRDVRNLLAGARALLMPSFAEGYGMPVTEALALGTPVICSDLPALHEAGGAAARYLDPLDGVGWQAAIREAADRPVSARPGWPGPNQALPSWPEHIAILIDLVHRLAT